MKSDQSKTKAELIQELKSLRKRVNAKDITKRKQAEEKLIISGKTWSNTFHSIVDPVSIHDKDFKLLKVNKAFAEFVGVKPKDLIGKHCYEVVHDLKIPFTGCPHEEMMKTGKDTTSVLYETNLGKYLQISVSPIFNEDGELNSCVHIIKDVTESKKAEEALAKSEEKYRTLFETMAQGVIYQNTDGQIISANPSAERILGLTLDQMQGLTSMDPRWRSIHEDSSDFPGETHPSMVSLKTGKPVKDVVMRVFNPKDEKHKWININAVPQFRPGEKKPYQVYTTFDDITERRQTEKELHTIQMHYTDFINASSNQVSYWKMPAGLKTDLPIDEQVEMMYNSYCVDANKKLWELVGFTKKDELIGMKIIELFRKKIQDENFRNFIKNNYHLEGHEFHDTFPDGREFYALSNWYGVVEDGCLVNLWSVSEDITERKLAEKELKSSEEKYSSVVENSNDGIVIIKDEKIAYVNAAVKNLLGFEPNDVIGRNVAELVAQDYREFATQRFRDRLSGKKVPSIYEISLIRKDGSLIPVEINAALMSYDGESAGLVFLRDITDRKRSEEELEKSVKYYRSLFENIADGIFIFDVMPNGTFLYVDFNPAEENIMGMTAEQIRGRTPYDLIEKEDAEKVNSRYQRCVDVKRITRYEEEMELSRGRSFFSTTLVPLKNEDGDVFRIIGMARDITERKLAEEELNKAYKEIRDLKDILQAENIYLRKTIEPSSLHKDIVGSSPHIKDVIEKALQVAPMDSTVLLTGETGTGKELITKGIHNASKRKNKTLITVNCAAIPDALIESELFGHEKGAFTDAHSKKIGLFEIADKSTIFLDEIGELPYNTQSKLLRVIENKEVSRIGSSQPVKVDVRIIAATNQDLPTLVKEKQFRQDLYYRLNVFPIELPPLRTRKQDIKLLVEKFVEEFNQHMGKKVSTIPKKTMEVLEKYNWPGNVRELRNIIERSMITSTGSTLKLELKQFTKPIETEMTTLEDVERSYIQEVLEMTYWKISGKDSASEILDINPSTLRSRIEKLGISKPK